MPRLVVPAALGLLLSGCLAPPAEHAVRWPGLRPDGSVLLPNQWSLRPAGAQLRLGDFPVHIALHPAGRHAAILHCGYGPHEIVVVDLQTGAIASRLKIAEAFYGLVFDAGGERLYCSGASAESVRVLKFADGKLEPEREIPLREPQRRGIPGGLALSADGRRLAAANVWGQDVSLVDLATGVVTNLPIGAPDALVSAGATGVTTNLDADAIVKRAAAALDPSKPEAPFPFACRFDDARGRLYVSLWAQASVAVIDLKTLKIAARWPVEEHPCEMALSRDGRHLFVANANRNTVTVLDAETGRAVETLSSSLHPSMPPGSTPNSLALSPDGRTLYVANACNNTVAVFDVSEPGRSRSLGLIPTGWYPTSVRVTADGRRLLVANGKGDISRANPKGPQPVRPPPGTVVEYIGGLFKGTLSTIELPAADRAEAVFGAWTAEARRCSPLRGDLAPSAAPPRGHPVPARVGAPSPIRHCIYVIKENRTYDQMLGDLPGGNGDPTLCLFPEQVTPNHHRLAREFVLLDNFYVESEVSADGHEWSMGAYATDFVERSWPLSYGHGGSKKYPFPAEGNFPVAFPAGGYLWDRAKAAGITYRSYGEFITDGAKPGEPGRARVAGLEGHFDPFYRGFDLNFSDLKRVDRFLEELRGFEAGHNLPRLTIVRLPNDHTAGASVGQLTPTAFVAENDLALGRLVEGISRSKFWPETAIFVVEDDAQNGPDHVDAHRTVAFVISPWSRGRGRDSTMYSTSSMLRTMELILGLDPMSQFDAAACPMYGSFHTRPDLRPWTHSPANVPLDERTPATAWGAEPSRRMDLSREDAADDLLLNEVIWRSVRGAHHPMPAPVRAAFVRVEHDDD